MFTLISDSEIQSCKRTRDRKNADYYVAIDDTNDRRIAQSQLDDINNRQLPELLQKIKSEMEKYRTPRRYSTRPYEEFRPPAVWWQSFWDKILGE